MGKISCNVIKDLLPSYVEDICSHESKELVEEHLVGCRECQSLVEMMKETEIVSEKVDDRQIDYMKKVRQGYTRKSMVSLGLLIICLLVGMIMMISNYRFDSVNLYYCYIVVPVIMAGTYYALFGQWTKGRRAKWQFVMGGIGILLITYCTILRFVVIDCANGIKQGTYLLRLSPEEIGPFFHWQLLAVIEIQIIMLFVAIVISLKTRVFHGILIDIHSMGCCLAFALNLILTKLTTLEEFRKIWNRSFLIVLVEGILIAVMVMILRQERQH